MSDRVSKVLILTNSTLGLYLFRKELISALILQGYQVYASSPYDGCTSELKSLGITLIETQYDRGNTNPIRDVLLFLHYKKLVREIKPDIILAYTIKPNVYGNLAAKGYKVPVISTITGLGEVFIRSSLVSFIVKVLYRAAFKSVKCVVFQNREDEHIMRSARIIHDQKVLLVNGSGVNLIEHTSLEYPCIPIVSFLYIGRIMETKGIEQLIMASRRLKLDNSGEFSVTLIGSYDGNVREKVETAVNEGIIFYLGFQSDIKPILRNAHCIVLPSYYKEGMSNALLEAAASARPLITTDISGCREIVEDGINGLICKPRDADSLYICMRDFLMLSNEQRKNMGIASRRKVELEFDRIDVVDSMLREIKCHSD